MKPRLGIAIGSAVGAIVAMVIGFVYGRFLHHLHPPPTTEQRAIAWAAAGAFVVLGTYSVRRFANQLGRAISRADRAAASVVRLIMTIAGVLVVLAVTLAMLRIGVSQLLLGGAITGVVIGIAAQQSLGNMFAGIVLLVAHPFRAGDRVRVRTGSLGGAFEGQVVSMGLTYVVFITDEGTTLVPNLTILASGIVRNPRPLDSSGAGQNPPAQAPPVAASGPVNADPPPAPPNSASLSET